MGCLTFETYFARPSQKAKAKAKAKLGGMGGWALEANTRGWRMGDGGCEKSRRGCKRLWVLSFSTPASRLMQRSTASARSRQRARPATEINRIRVQGRISCANCNRQYAKTCTVKILDRIQITTNTDDHNYIEKNITTNTKLALIHSRGWDWWFITFAVSVQQFWVWLSMSLLVLSICNLI